MDKTRYVLVLLVVAMVPPGIIWWYMVHPFVDFWRRFGAKVTNWIVGVTMVALMVVLGMNRRWLVGADLGTNWILAGLGLVCFGIAIFIGLKRRRFLTRRILAGVPELDRDNPGTLLTEGPYSIIRHPRYVEVLIGVLGYALFANYVGGYVVTALLVPGLHLVVLLEERELAQRFGAAYEAYRTQVPRYIPRWGPGDGAQAPS